MSPESLAEKFWKLVNQNSGTFCWLWTGRTDAGGYGLLNGKRAHRVSWELHKGTIAPGKILRHRCDNPLCVNPDHLVVGTHYDNAVDRQISRRTSFRQIPKERGHSISWWPGNFEPDKAGTMRPPKNAKPRS